MERKLKNFWVLSLGMFLLTGTAQAKNDNVWDDIVRKLFKKSKVIKLTAGRETKPHLRFTPKVVSFKGSVELPSAVYLTSGNGKKISAAAQIIVDGQIVCDYSPKSNSHVWSKVYYLEGCSDGSRSRDQIYVNNKIELKLNHASSDKASLLANVRVLSSDQVEYGLVFPYLNPSEGQILMFNGEAWVAADPSELDLQGLQGEQGEMGPMGPQGPAGAQGPQGEPGVAGPAGEKGEKGDKGDKGDPGVAGAAGAVGPQGPAGAAGAAGPMGPQGPKGDKGDPGVAGAAGAVGPQGPAGAAGPMGPMGPQGPKGNDGAPGVAGATGAQGPQGPVGPAGAIGPMGPQGPAGADGAPGVAGAAGPVGPQGPKGNDGAPGAAGPMGPMGPAGAQGPAGAIGPMGPQGLPGEAGPQGPKGDKGDKGEQGERGLSEIAYIRDQKASNVAGGTCTAGSWITRDLNTLGGDTTFISLSNDSFVLQPGKYFIEVNAPGFGIGSHQAKLKVIETNTDVLFGTGMVSHPTSPSTTHSVISGEIVVSEVSSFEIQHRCSNSKNNLGFGWPMNFTDSPEIYTQVKIIKKQ